MRLQTLKRNPIHVQSEQEVAIPLLQPWPPPVFMSAAKPGVYDTLPEGFKGEGEISNTYTLPLFQIRHFVLTDRRLALSRGRGGERFFRGQAPLEFEDVLLRGSEPPDLAIFETLYYEVPHLLKMLYYEVLHLQNLVTRSYTSRT